MSILHFKVPWGKRLTCDSETRSLASLSHLRSWLNGGTLFLAKASLFLAKGVPLIESEYISVIYVSCWDLFRITGQSAYLKTKT